MKRKRLIRGIHYGIMELPPCHELEIRKSLRGKGTFIRETFIPKKNSEEETNPEGWDQGDDDSLPDEIDDE